MIIDNAEIADLETSSADYASRFAGRAGAYMLQVQSEAVRAVLADCPPGRVLDVGGGHGQLVDLLAELGWQVTVMGSSPDCGTNLRTLHRKTRCDYLTADLLHAPFPDQSFDLVVSVRLLPHTTRWEALVAEMCRLAGRWVVVDYPSTGGFNALTPLLFGMKKRFERNTRTYRSFATAELDREFGHSRFLRRATRKQFLLPMVVHRASGSAAPVRWMESLGRALGLTALAGSPVVARYDREAAR
ncbi:MAG: class I SAM-dependent methyltransferase [Sinobacteraceae bacterium]|nr:class I SAM-dependent methyltransferase [Nevskiaceae bacterium]MCP5339590.1 class I SAM-dependent methyltransferase [Nevskiaceae bacterium]